MEQDTSTGQIQIITHEGNLAEDFKHRAKEPDLAKFGKDYHIVSIIGNQSTGKSTLLNKLFGTTFSVMDASRVRKQTTKGILISKDQDKHILVCDVEGADSAQRWDGHEPFEQCTALFSLVLSQVIMVNINTQEVGRFTGSNYGVLKVIFENNLKLFKQEGSKKLIFVLRDYDESENKDTIVNTIKEDIARIWAEIIKPKEHITSTPDQFFEFEFVFLTNFKWLRQQFDQQCQEFRQKFVDPNHPEYLFKHHDINNNVPIDGLYLFMENVWTTIKECKDINLPGQRTLVANLRCTDIKNEIVSSLDGRVKELKEKASKGPYAEFGREGEGIVRTALESYDSQTENYEKAVVEEKRKELISGLVQNLHDAFEKQVSTIRKNTVSELSSQLNGIKVNPDNLGNVMEKAKAVQSSVTSQFEDALKNTLIASSDWNTDLVVSEVKQQIDETVSAYREKQLAFILKQKGTQIRRDLEAETIRLFNNLDNDFWVVLDNFYNENVRTAESYVKNMLSDSFELNSDLIQAQIKNLNDDAYKDLESDLKNRFLELQYFMLKKFRNTFGKNENNVPINWKTLKPEEIESKYVHAKKVCNDLMQNLKYFNIRKRGEDYLEKKPVLSEREFETVNQRVNEDYETELADAQRKRAASEMGAIPKWFWGILVFFMYDDVLQWFKSPFILGFLIYPLFIVGCLIALAFATGYGSNMTAILSNLTGLIKLLLGSQLKKLGINL